jgi:hypothetical protein
MDVRAEGGLTGDRPSVPHVAADPGQEAGRAEALEDDRLVVVPARRRGAVRECLVDPDQIVDPLLEAVAARLFGVILVIDERVSLRSSG